MQEAVSRSQKDLTAPMLYMHKTRKPKDEERYSDYTTAYNPPINKVQRRDTSEKSHFPHH